MAEEYDYLFKSIVIGDGGVGKTALTLRFSKGFFTEDYKMTIGVDFHVKTISIDTDEGPIRAKLQIWDTGGQERFSSIRPMYYRGSLGALLIFDVTNSASFEHLPQWIEEIRANVKAEIPLLLVGNKSDLIEQRTVSLEEINEFTQNFDLYYMETSAKTGEGVGDCFYILACLMIGSGVPNQLISNGIVFTPGQIPITSEGTSKPFVPQLEGEIDFAAPPVPEPSSIKVEESSPSFEPEPEFEYAAPPVPEPSPIKTYEPDVPITETKIEEPVKKPHEFIFKTPDEILSDKSLEEEQVSPIVESVVEETYKPKAVPFTSNIPVPVAAPNGFDSTKKASTTKSKAPKPAPFLPTPESEMIDKKTPEKKKKKEKDKKIKEEKEKAKKEEEKRLKEEKEKAKKEEEKRLKEEEEKAKKEEEKRLKEEEKAKKEEEKRLKEEKEKAKKEKKKEKTKKQKKEKAKEITPPPIFIPSESKTTDDATKSALFKALSQKVDSSTSFVPFAKTMNSESGESNNLRIIPNLPSGAPETLTCTKCGAILSSDYMFCNKCGNKL